MKNTSAILTFGTKRVPKTVRYHDDYAEVELTKGVYTLVDLEDVERIRRYSWWLNEKSGKHYAAGGGFRMVGLHRFIMEVSDPNEVVDHIDGDGLNNRKVNLRICTQAQNTLNRSTTSSSTGYIGVYPHTSNVFRYQSSGVGAKSGFRTAYEAAIARDLAILDSDESQYLTRNFPGKTKEDLEREYVPPILRNRTGYYGVSRQSQHDSYLFNYKGKKVGGFKTAEEAARAREDYIQGLLLSAAK